jgi:hypothetical protein
MRELCRRLKPVDIAPVLAVLDRLPFVPANIGSTNPEKAPCFVVPAGFALPEEIPEFVSGLDLGGETKRVLLRKLGPRQGMAPHIDGWMPKELNWRRFQVPLVSHPSIVMRWPEDDFEVYLAPGFLYEVNFSRLHEVVNNADCERVHLQIDQVDATI